MNLEEIRALCEAATPGPWAVDTFGNIYKPARQGNVAQMRGANQEHADAAFIAAARTLLPKLLEVAEAADRLTDNICEFSTITDSIFVENLDDALFALEADS